MQKLRQRLGFGVETLAAALGLGERAAGEVGYLPYGWVDAESEGWTPSTPGMLEQAAGANSVVKLAREHGVRNASSAREVFQLARQGDAWTGRSGRLRFRWSGAARARPGDGGLALTVTLPAGGHHDLVLELSDRNIKLDLKAGVTPLEFTEITAVLKGQLKDGDALVIRSVVSKNQAPGTLRR